MKIVVLAGGLSTERDVSLASSKAVEQALRNKGYKARVLDIYLGTDNYDNFFDETEKEENIINKKIPDLSKLKKIKNADGYFGKNVLKICKEADLVFNMIHGEIGENGKLQAAFDLLNIKYTGTKYLGAAISMNKDIAKLLVKKHNILTPASQIITHKKDKPFIFYPVVVKPNDGGSSIGVSIVTNDKEYKKAVKEALKYNDEVLVEEYIKGREFSVGILKDKALPVIEIIPKVGFFDYENKYQKDKTEEICPANLNEKQTKEVQDIALSIFNILKLKTYARIDFILDEKNKFYFLEANTTPGMSKASLFPKEAKALNISFEDLCEIIALDAL